jgi:hypothetical protein
METWSFIAIQMEKRLGVRKHLEAALIVRACKAMEILWLMTVMIEQLGALKLLAMKAHRF